MSALLKSITAAGLLALAAASAHAQTAPATPPAPGAPPPIVIYKDALSENWSNISWAHVTLQVPAGDVKPIKVEGDAGSALVLHTDHPVYTKGYNQLVFYVNGGGGGGQAITVKVTIGGKPVDSTVVIHPTVKTWTPVEVRLKDIGAADTNIDGIELVGNADGPYKPYYIDQLEIQ